LFLYRNIEHHENIEHHDQPTLDVNFLMPQEEKLLEDCKEVKEVADKPAVLTPLQNLDISMQT
jgi:hypothetical protein